MPASADRCKERRGLDRRAMQRIVMIVLLLTAIVVVAVFVLSPRLRTANPDEDLPYANEP
jgi:hypothetical protein